MPPTPNAETAVVSVDLSSREGPLHISRLAGMGQGGLSPDPMWPDRVAEIRSLKPHLIRIWLQPYFNPIQPDGGYAFEAIERAIAPVLAAGAIPLVTLNLKPPQLWNRIDETQLMPDDPDGWVRLVHALVGHFRDHEGGGWYWEIVGETDCGEGGGCPFLGNPETYPPFYALTARAILEADPDARVGGPGLGNCRDPLLPELLQACSDQALPLHFVSWHTYAMNASVFGKNARHVATEIARFPDLSPENICDEWSMVWGADLERSLDPAYLACHVIASIDQMRAAGIDQACYYQIRDYPAERSVFREFFTRRGAAFMSRWWTRMPQWGGLFDFNNTPRPVYFAFRMLANLQGDALPVTADHPTVRALATYDTEFQVHYILLWNYSPEPTKLCLHLSNLPGPIRAVPFTLDAKTPSNDINHRIRPADTLDLEGDTELELPFEGYGIQSLLAFQGGWDIGCLQPYSEPET